MNFVRAPEPIPKYEKEILISLSNSRKTFYDLAKNEKIASGNTVLNSLKSLEVKGYIEKGKPKGPRKSRYYSITSRGLYDLFFLYGKELVKDIDKIASQHADKLYLFKIWPELKGSGIVEDIKEVLFTVKQTDEDVDALIFYQLPVRQIDNFIPIMILLSRYENDTNKFNFLIDVVKKHDKIRSECASHYANSLESRYHEFVKAEIILRKIEAEKELNNVLSKYNIKITR